MKMFKIKGYIHYMIVVYKYIMDQSKNTKIIVMNVVSGFQKICNLIF